jgi:hypothetical protein
MSLEDNLYENLGLFSDDMMWHYQHIKEDFDRSLLAHNPCVDGLTGKAAFLVVMQSYLRHLEKLIDHMEDHPAYWTDLDERDDIEIDSATLLRNTFNAAASHIKAPENAQQAYLVAREECALIEKPALVAEIDTALLWLEDNVERAPDIIKTARKRQGLPPQPAAGTPRLN